MHLKIVFLYVLFVFNTNQGRAQDDDKYVRNLQSTLVRITNQSSNDTNISSKSSSAVAVDQLQQKSNKKDLSSQEVVADKKVSGIVEPVPSPNKDEPIKKKEDETPPANNTTPVAISGSNEIKPGTVKRGVIVFGSLTLLFIGYMSYKIWRKSTDSQNKDDYLSESPLFKYGVLKSDDNPEHMELSRMPLTVDSEDDDDLEIFDLEHNKRQQSPKLHYNPVAKDDIQILDLELPSQENQNDRNFVLLDLNNDSFPITNKGNSNLV